MEFTGYYGDLDVSFEKQKFACAEPNALKLLSQSERDEWR